MATIARYLIAFFFVASGSGKIFAFRQSSTALASIGFPIPTFFLIVFLIFATITVHLRFVRDPVAGTDQVVHIIKNIAIIGGLFNLIAF
jgi:uncharacterized membrane protein YphA (DoxX/SURF4 family)